MAGVLVLSGTGRVGWSTAFAREPAAATIPIRVVIVSGSLDTYRVVSNRVLGALTERGLTVDLYELPGAPQTEERRSLISRVKEPAPALILTAGDAATEWVCQEIQDIPILFVLVANILDEDYVGKPGAAGRARSGVAADVAPDALLTAIRQASPALRRLAVPHSASTRRTVDSLRETAGPLGIEIVPILAEKNRFLDALNQLGETPCDAVLMIADPRVYDAANIRGLLAWGVRRSKPIWGFSANVVKAGAYAGVFFDDKRIAAQAVDLVLRSLDPNPPPLPPFEYAAARLRAVNLHTSNMIGQPIGEKFLGDDVLRFGEQP